MKLKIGNLKSKIETDNLELLKLLYDRYSYKIPGSEYSQRYKKHHWDGKKHFISKSGFFRTGLLNKLLYDLKEIDCEPELEYIDTVKEITPSCFDMAKFKYYTFQDEFIRKAISGMRGVIKSPTGSGKTLIMAGIVKALHGRKMVILFNAKQLLKQTYEFFLECGIEDLGICFGEGFIEGDIMLSTVQSVDKIADSHVKHAEVLLVDECHEFAKGKRNLAVIESFPKAQYRLGFTATPPSDHISKLQLEGALGPVWSKVSTADLVEDGKLTRPVIQLVNRSYLASGLDESMSYMEVYDNYITHNDLRNKIIREIADDIKNKNKRARILILTKSLDHGRALEDLLGGQCEFLEGANSIGERYKAISRFRGCRDSSILIGTKILQTGINIEEITHFINARGLKSEVATIQALGRALRKSSNKDKVYVYDFLDKEKYLHGHSLERKSHYEKEGHEVVIL